MAVKARIRPGDGDPRHGTSNGYGNHGCRCDACRTANTAYMRERGTGSYRRDPCPVCGGPKRLAAAMCRSCRDESRVPQHGTESRYRHRGCKCVACLAAAAAERRARRHVDIEATRAYDREYRRRRNEAAA